MQPHQKHSTNSPSKTKRRPTKRNEKSVLNANVMSGEQQMQSYACAKETKPCADLIGALCREDPREDVWKFIRVRDEPRDI